MFRIRRILVLTVVIYAMLIATALADDEVSLKRSEVPEAVLNAFEKSHPDLHIEEFDKELIDGKSYYEITTKANKLKTTYIYVEDGTLFEVEEDIPIIQLPTLVSKAAEEAHPGCEIEEAERITRGSVVEYEIVAELEDHEYELVVSSDGKLVSSTLLEDDDDHENDQDSDSEDHDNDEDDN